MIVTTFHGRAVREPVARSVHDVEAEEVVPACNFCGSDVWAPKGDKGPVWCSSECRKADGHAAAEDARADLEEEV